MEYDKDPTFKVKTIVKKSNIEGAGRGRFVLEDCKKGTIIRKSKIDEDLIIFNNLEELSSFYNKSEENVDRIENFAWSNKTKVNKVFLYNNHFFYNFGFSYNFEHEFTDNYYLAYCNQDLKSGDELLGNYLSYPKIEWFENFMISKNKKCPRMFAESLQNSM